MSKEIAKGIKQGLEKGKQEGKMDIEVINKVTGLSKKEIEKL